MTFGTTFTQPNAQSAAGLDKTDLKDALCVIKLIEVKRNVETKFGSSTRADAEVLVVSGPLSGKDDPEFVAFGNLANQMARIGEGNTSLARVIYGENGTKTFWGLNFDLREGDMAAAEAAVTAFKDDQGPTQLKNSL